jgi:serine/threonine protein kinase
VKDGDNIGKFQVLGTLGQGAHSSIMHVRRAADSKQYALKVVKVDGPEEMKFLEQARHEYRVAKMLDHPNILKIYALEEQKDWLFRVKQATLLLEYVNGKTLDVVPALPIHALVQVFTRVASAMAHMHRRGVVHADMKPSNLMLSRTGDVKVIDFGLAAIKGEDKERVQGTLEYMAPETAKRKIINERTDIFNFGATMYRLVTFRLPPPVVPAEGGVALDAEAYRKQLKPIKQFNAEAPVELDDLIYRCLSWNANDRPERMSDVYDALNHLVEELVTSSGDKLERFEW